MYCFAKLCRLCKKTSKYSCLQSLEGNDDFTFEDLINCIPDIKDHKLNQKLTWICLTCSNTIKSFLDLRRCVKKTDVDFEHYDNILQSNCNNGDKILIVQMETDYFPSSLIISEEANEIFQRKSSNKSIVQVSSNINNMFLGNHENKLIVGNENQLFINEEFIIKDEPDDIEDLEPTSVSNQIKYEEQAEELSNEDVITDNLVDSKENIRYITEEFIIKDDPDDVSNLEETVAVAQEEKDDEEINENNVNKKSIHSAEKPYNCRTCSKQFTYLSQLKRHILIHTGEKQYKCDTCDKRFIRKGDLKKHIAIHTGEKPYKCNTCGKRFKSKVTFNRHARIHTAEKPI